MTISVSWAVTIALLVIYLAGLMLGLAGTASWHLLAVVAAILLIYNVLSRRGR